MPTWKCPANIATCVSGPEPSAAARLPATRPKPRAMLPGPRCQGAVALCTATAAARRPMDGTAALAAAAAATPPRCAPARAARASRTGRRPVRRQVGAAAVSGSEKYQRVTMYATNPLPNAATKPRAIRSTDTHSRISGSICHPNTGRLRRPRTSGPPGTTSANSSMGASESRSVVAGSSAGQSSHAEEAAHSSKKTPPKDMKPWAAATEREMRPSGAARPSARTVVTAASAQAAAQRSSSCSTRPKRSSTTPTAMRQTPKRSANPSCRLFKVDTPTSELQRKR
mmetsp:Transcript_13464/g.47463  ORF Transcript_13464/g.47463 Transcript_13464/m.47463 type:complete len:284 (+) Transcript_13464:670-1521(+)